MVHMRNVFLTVFFALIVGGAWPEPVVARVSNDVNNQGFVFTEQHWWEFYNTVEDMYASGASADEVYDYTTAVLTWLGQADSAYTPPSHSWPPAPGNPIDPDPNPPVDPYSAPGQGKEPYDEQAPLPMGPQPPFPGCGAPSCPPPDQVVVPSRDVAYAFNALGIAVSTGGGPFAVVGAGFQIIAIIIHRQNDEEDDE